MRIAIGGFCHETNMFGNVRVDMALLQRATREGEALRKAYTGSHGYVGGYIDEAAALGVGNVSIVVGGGVKNGVGVSRTQTFDDGPFRVVGVDWQHTHVLALKSAQHFKGWWADKVKAIISCESPGLMSADLSTFCFKQLDKAYYPFKDAQWDP